MQNKKRSVYLPEYDLKNSCSYNVNIIISRKSKSIIKGTVYNENKVPSVGAAIEVKEINPNTNASIIVGYSFTDDNGEYAFVIEVHENMYYEFNIYSPLTK